MGKVIALNIFILKDIYIKILWSNSAVQCVQQKSLLKGKMAKKLKTWGQSINCWENQALNNAWHVDTRQKDLYVSHQVN